MTFTLDRSASNIDHFYKGHSVTITSLPSVECDRRLLEQERKVAAYSALLREVMLESPFVPPPPPGVEIIFGGKMGAKYREVRILFFLFSTFCFSTFWGRNTER